MSISDFLTSYGTSLPVTLSAIFIGLILSMTVLLYNRYVPGRLVRHLIKERIHTPDQAVSLSQIGIKEGVLIRHSLREGGMLRKLLATVSDESPAVDDGPKAKAKKPDYSTLRFYLPEEQAYRAEVSYNNNGASVLSVLLAVMLFLVMMFLIAILAPNLIQMLSNFIDSLKTA